MELNLGSLMTNIGPDPSHVTETFIKRFKVTNGFLLLLKPSAGYRAF